MRAALFCFLQGRKRWLWPLALAAPLLVMLQFLDVDRSVSNFFYDAATRRFPWRDDWWLTRVFHDGVKWLVIAFGLGVLVTGLLGFLRPGLRRYRTPAFLLVFAMALSASTVSAVKYFSNHACPYDLSLYGGHAPRLAFFEPVPAGLKPGRCWPGGHASTAFSLFALYFAARRASRPRLAAGLLLFVLLFGAVLGIVQTMRGAHFLSHQVWTALICWYVTALVYRWAAPEHA